VSQVPHIVYNCRSRKYHVVRWGHNLSGSLSTRALAKEWLATYIKTHKPAARPTPILGKLLAYARSMAKAIVAAEAKAAALVHSPMAKALVKSQIEVRLTKKALAQFKGTRAQVTALIKALAKAISALK